MIHLAWSMPLLLFASIVIGWAAEITAVHLSAGIALAVLAWLQTAPEFAVEAVIAWSRNSDLVLANLTGSLRLLMGLGWPMIFFIHWYYSIKRKRSGKTVDLKTVNLPKNFSVESGGLILSLVYFFVIWLKGTWSAIDGIILISLYGVYFWLLSRQRKIGLESPDEDEEDSAGFVHKILQKSERTQKIWGFSFFAVGGVILILTAHPFINALQLSAQHFGISEYVFIQWIAPIASEFPEKVTAFNWARHPKKVPMAIMNMLSSIVCQWTLFAGIVPLIFSVSAGEWSTIHFSKFQETELLLTIAQSAVAVALLADLKIQFYEAAGLFILWLFQFFVPQSREEIAFVYLAWFTLEMIRLLSKPSQCVAWHTLKMILLGKKLN